MMKLKLLQINYGLTESVSIAIKPNKRIYANPGGGNCPFALRYKIKNHVKCSSYELARSTIELARSKMGLAHSTIES